MTLDSEVHVLEPVGHVLEPVGRVLEPVGRVRCRCARCPMSMSDVDVRVVISDPTKCHFRNRPVKRGHHAPWALAVRWYREGRGRGVYPR